MTEEAAGFEYNASTDPLRRGTTDREVHLKPGADELDASNGDRDSLVSHGPEDEDAHLG